MQTQPVAIYLSHVRTYIAVMKYPKAQWCSGEVAKWAK